MAVAGGATSRLKVASAHPHFGEETPLVGRHGSGTIFFSHCNLLCAYCQNWVSSQALRDFRSALDFQSLRPQDLVSLALRQEASSLISTYNEPLITAEWAVAIFREARAAGGDTELRQRGRLDPAGLELVRRVAQPRGDAAVAELAVLQHPRLERHAQELDDVSLTGN